MPRTPSTLSTFLSTPSARRATYKRDPLALPMLISIHALREEGDFEGMMTAIASALFLSTPSARRATPKPSRGGIRL